MLHVKFDICGDFKPDKNTIVDVEEAFDKIKLTGSEKDREILRVLEEGEYINNSSYIDRFGVKLPLDSISSGSKCAFCVLYFPDKVVDTRECGLNALSTIISTCNKGNVIIRDIQVKLPTYGFNTKINVECNGRHFTDFDDFNTFYDDEV